MKRVLIIDDALYRQLEIAAIVQNVPVETMTADLIRDGVAARLASRETKTKRPTATWPPAAERRGHA